MAGDRRRRRAVVCMLVIAAALSACTPPAPRGAFEVPEAVCTDVALVWARGSSAPVAAGAFAMARRALPTALSGVGRSVTVRALELGDLDADGVLDAGGYPAVAAVEYLGVDRIADPARELAVIGGYNESTRVGADELVSVLGALHSACPEQLVVVAGESQGADAVMKGLGRAPEHLLGSVAAVHVFGDPGFVVGPWMEGPGTVVPSGRGLLGPRSPYVPQVLEDRTTSWCARYDGVCTGQFWFAILDAIDECDQHPELLVCSRRHIDYATWAIEPAMRRAASSVAALMG